MAIVSRLSMILSDHGVYFVQTHDRIDREVVGDEVTDTLILFLLLLFCFFLTSSILFSSGVLISSSCHPFV